MTFFTISGYLVTLSWLRDPQVLPFAAKRLLRLWPGMLVAVALGSMVLGPIFTSLSVVDYLSHPETMEHWKNLLLVKAYVNLPGVFENNPLQGLMNGPLWTIPLELLCYAVLLAAAALGVFRYSWLATLLGLGYLAYFLVTRNADINDGMQHWWEYPAYFVVGSLIAVHRGVFLRWRWHVVLALLPLAGFIFFGLEFEHSAGLLLLPPLLISIGSLRGRFFSAIQRAGDPSYGIYVLGCPVQQVVQAIFPTMPFMMSMLAAMGLALLVGYGSWHLVESPMLRLKRYVS